MPCEVKRFVLTTLLFNFTLLHFIYLYTQLKGLIATLLQLDETLDNVFSTKVEGVDCVIKSKDSAFTYTVKNGVAVVK